MTLNRLLRLPRNEVTLGRLLRAVWRRLSAIPDSISYRLEAGPGSDHFERIRSMKDQHRRERCFVLGNGPSRARMDLGLLRGHLTIAVRIWDPQDESVMRSESPARASLALRQLQFVDGRSRAA